MLEPKIMVLSLLISKCFATLDLPIQVITTVRHVTRAAEHNKKGEAGSWHLFCRKCGKSEEVTSQNETTRELAKTQIASSAGKLKEFRQKHLDDCYTSEKATILRYETARRERSHSRCDE